MKIEIKKLAAVTFSALGMLPCFSASFCKASSVEYTDIKECQESSKENLQDHQEIMPPPGVYIADPSEKEEDKIDELGCGIKSLLYPIATFDVERFNRVIYLNKMYNSWDVCMCDNDPNPVYGFCIFFEKGFRSVCFFFNPMEAPEKFAGPNWNKTGFSLETFFDNFEKYVQSFGFEEESSYSKMSERCTVFKVPSEMTCLGSETFRNFSNLKRVVIPGSVEKISEDVFKDCKKLESIFYNSKNYSNVEEFMKDFNSKHKGFFKL